MVVEGYWNAPDAFAEPGLVEATSADSVFVFPPTNATTYRASAVRAMVPATDCASRDAVDARFDLVAWLDVRATGKRRQARFINEVARADDEVQQRWVRQRLAELKRC